MSKIEMKPAMSMDEMSEAYAQDNPGFIPNRNAVGRYARKQGNRLAWQKIKGVKRYFYVKNNG